MSEFKQPRKSLPGIPVSEADLQQLAGAGSELDEEMKEWKKLSDADLVYEAMRIESDLTGMRKDRWIPGTAQSIQSMEARHTAIFGEVQRRGLSLP
jgi:hypothetical protein